MNIYVGNPTVSNSHGFFGRGAPNGTASGSVSIELLSSKSNKSKLLSSFMIKSPYIHYTHYITKNAKDKMLWRIFLLWHISKVRWHNQFMILFNDWFYFALFCASCHNTWHRTNRNYQHKLFHKIPLCFIYSAN